MLKYFDSTSPLFKHYFLVNSWPLVLHFGSKQKSKSLEVAFYDILDVLLCPLKNTHPPLVKLSLSYYRKSFLPYGFQFIGQEWENLGPLLHGYDSGDKHVNTCNLDGSFQLNNILETCTQNYKLLQYHRLFLSFPCSFCFNGVDMLDAIKKTSIFSFGYQHNVSHCK